MPTEDRPELSNDLLSQLRGALDRLNSMVWQVPGVAPAGGPSVGLPSIPTPGSISAAQVAAIAGAIRAQRGAIESLRTGLDAFEQQLEVLERLLEPLESMTQAWAQLERRFTG
ncbi:MAG TPA: hypothetical protein VGJ95_19320 [Pseudonocardiaceae bacterium]|jgi:hypothetical protein